MIRSKRTMSHISVNEISFSDLQMARYGNSKEIIFYATNFQIEAIRLFLMLPSDKASFFSRMICQEYENMLND